MILMDRAQLDLCHSLFPNTPRVFLCVECDGWQLYLAIGPAQFDLVHPPQFVDIFCQLVPDVVQVRGKNNLQREKGNRW